MSRSILMIVATTFGFVLFAFHPEMHAAQTGNLSYVIRVVDAPQATVLGQDEAAERKGPGLFERMKRSFNNWVKDDEEVNNVENGKVKSPNDRPKSVMPTVPATPPKPVTATEVRQSTAKPEERERTPTPDRRVTSVSPAPSVVTPKASQVEQQEATVDSADQEDSIYKRLQIMRNQVFDDVPARKTIEEPAEIAESSSPMPMRQPASPRTVAVESTRPAPSSTSRNPIEEQPERTARPSVPDDSAKVASRPTPMQPRTQVMRVPERAPIDYWNQEEVATTNEAKPVNALPPRVERKAEEKLPPLGGFNVAGESPWNRMNNQQNGLRPQSGSTPVASANPRPNAQPDTRDPYPVSPGTIETSDAQTMDTTPIQARTETLAEREKSFLISPRIEVETEGDSKIIVGQESTYRVRVRNRGGAPAEQVVVTVEVPNWIEVLPPDVSTGTTSIVPKGANQSSRDFTWKISRVESAAEEQLVLHLVPQERKTVDLRIKYDFYKPAVVAKIVVQEPVLEMELQGPNEVLWGSKVGYKLLVRNTGNGDAEKVKFELLQSGSDMKSYEHPLLKAGEELAIDVDVSTGRQDHIDIDILATGAYDLTAKVFKRVSVLQPELTIKVESAEMQFVDSPAEFVISVRNEGSAPATNVELTATVPLGARYISNTGGGQANPQNQVSWNIASIPVGEAFTASILCEPKREGICKLDAAINDKSGLIANCSGAFTAQAIADLKMQVDNPQGPIEVGQEATFTINIVNRGTKTAEDVEVIAAFARGLEPFAVEGANGVMNDGQVVFDKIPSISAGQTVVLKVKGKADRPGNHRMRTEVICPAVNTHLVFEQATYFYQKYNKGKVSAIASEKGAVESGGTPPSPLSTVRGGTEPQPLRNAPATTVPNTASSKSDDPFLR